MHNPSYLKECIKYNPKSGKMTWLDRPAHHFKSGQKSADHQASIWNAKFAGCPAFAHVGNHGYKTSSLGGKRMLAHRVAWAVYYGEWPEGEIDHINGDPTDNRIANLRCVTRQQNAKNRSVKSGGSRGVYWYAPTSRWAVKIHSGGKMHHVGYFLDRSDAIKARRDAEKAHGFHENHGRAY